MDTVDLMIIRIKKVKKENKITNKKLSEITGISISTLSKILGNQTKDPSISNVIKIADALNVSVEYLIYGKEKQTNLSTKEMEILHKYNNLDNRGKETVENALNEQYKQCINNKQDELKKLKSS